MRDVDWKYTHLREFTLEDALEAYKEGFCSICKDGKVGMLTNDPDLGGYYEGR